MDLPDHECLQATLKRTIAKVNEDDLSSGSILSREARSEGVAWWNLVLKQASSADLKQKAFGKSIGLLLLEWGSRGKMSASFQRDLYQMAIKTAKAWIEAKDPFKSQDWINWANERHSEPHPDDLERDLVRCKILTATDKHAISLRMMRENWDGSNFNSKQLQQFHQTCAKLAHETKEGKDKTNWLQYMLKVYDNCGLAGVIEYKRQVLLVRHVEYSYRI